MHPSASAEACRGHVIDSHTIQRKGPLERIVDSRNHVMRFKLESGGIKVAEVGWNRASTFPGYCSAHDAGLFAPLEQRGFDGSREQSALLAFRNVCNELYKKRALLESLQYQRDNMDRGRDLDGQITAQVSLSMNLAGQTKSCEELEVLWARFNSAITQGNFDQLESRCFFFKGDISVVSTGAMHAEYGFDGTKHADLWNLAVDGEMLSHSTAVTDAGGAIAFTWFKDTRAPREIVASFERVPDQDKGDVFAQYCFLNCENTYFSRAWWDALGQEAKEAVSQLAKTLHYEGGAFLPNKKRLVNWAFDV